MNKFFLVQVKRTNDIIEKGVAVKDTLDDACQSLHAYLGAYAYGKDASTDYVMVYILNPDGLGLKGEVWKKAEEPVENESVEG